MNRKGIAVSAAMLLSLAACEGLKEAMTAHVDVVARVDERELSVERLADMISGSRLPVSRDVAEAVSGLWVDYHLVAKAAANADSIIDPAVIDSAMWAEIASTRVQRFMDTVSAGWQITPATEAAYTQGDLLAAQHILIRIPPTALSQAERDSLRREAEALRARVTGRNFAQVATRESEDPGSAQRGGSLGVFPRGTMVPEFERALASLAPGEISPVVQTQFGYHIIRRPTWAEVQADFAPMYEQRQAQVAESTFVAGVEAAANVQIRRNAAATVREVAADPDAHRRDRTVLASWKGGELTAGRFSRWLATFPPQARIAQRVQEAPDSLIPDFLRQIVRNELAIRQADSAKVVLTAGEQAELRGAFTGAVQAIWQQLRIAPGMYPDTADTADERERIAYQRVEEYLAALMRNEAQFVQVPPQVRAALDQRYEYDLNLAGVERAVERAQRLRAVADSARAAQQPPSQVPLPAPQPGAGAPQP